MLSEQFVRSHLGQATDIYWSRHATEKNLRVWCADDTGPRILQSYAYKTGAVVAGVSEVACILARADETTRRTCAAFGSAFGVAYQIADDVRNFADRRRAPETVGDDIREGKLTYVVFRALERLTPRDRDELGSILCSPRRRRDAQALRMAASLVRRSGALDSCAAEATGMFRREWTALARVVPPSEAWIFLRALCSTLLDVEVTPRAVALRRE